MSINESIENIKNIYGEDIKTIMVVVKLINLKEPIKNRVN